MFRCTLDQLMQRGPLFTSLGKATLLNLATIIIYVIALVYLCKHKTIGEKQKKSFVREDSNKRSVLKIVSTL
jgi:hypothetical protein